jgi:hypothetical protein
MFPLQNTATKNVIAQASTATNATASGVVDTLGFDEVAIDAFLDSAAATSSNPSVLKVQHCDTSDGTFNDITGLVGDATDGFAVPAADTANPQIVRLNVDKRSRRRWLKVLITPAGAAQVVGATAVCGKAGDSTIARAAMAAVADA